MVPDPVSPEALVARHIENARRQLAEARENLKASRRRVVQLEDALCNWERFAADHTAMRDDEDFWDRCNEQFDPELLTDLALSCAMWLGMGRMLRTLDIGQSCKITL